MKVVRTYLRDWRRDAFKRREYWRDAIRHTRKRLQDAAEEVLSAAAAALCAGAVGAFFSSEGPISESLIAAALAGGMSLGLFYVFLFLRHLSLAPQRVRRLLQRRPGEQGHMIATITVRDTDVMQREASLIVAAIRRWLEQSGDPHDLAPVTELVTAFGRRANEDPWIPARSRVRSLEFYDRLSSSRSLLEIQAMCVDFMHLPPRH